MAAFILPPLVHSNPVTLLISPSSALESSEIKDLLLTTSSVDTEAENSTSIPKQSDHNYSSTDRVLTHNSKFSVLQTQSPINPGIVVNENNQTGDVVEPHTLPISKPHSAELKIKERSIKHSNNDATEKNEEHDEFHYINSKDVDSKEDLKISSRSIKESVSESVPVPDISSHVNNSTNTELSNIKHTATNSSYIHSSRTSKSIEAPPHPILLELPADQTSSEDHNVQPDDMSENLKSKQKLGLKHDEKRIQEKSIKNETEDKHVSITSIPPQQLTLNQTSVAEEKSHQITNKNESMSSSIPVERDGIRDNIHYHSNTENKSHISETPVEQNSSTSEVLNTTWQKNDTNKNSSSETTSTTIRSVIPLIPSSSDVPEAAQVSVAPTTLDMNTDILHELSSPEPTFDITETPNSLDVEPTLTTLEEETEKPSHTKPPVSKERVAAPEAASSISPDSMDAASITGITLGIVVLASLVGKLILGNFNFVV